MKQFILTILGVFVLLSLKAQQFNVEMSGYSNKKITYVTMDDGSKMEINLWRLKIKKGLVTEVIYKDDAKEKQTISVEDIKEMYVPYSDMAKLTASLETMGNLKKMSNRDIQADILDQGYAYYIKSDVKISKKKTRTLLLQVLNPKFCSEIMVFMDPYAAETNGIGVGVVELGGGDSKSYYVKVNDEVAYRLMKKDYKDASDELFGDCSKVKKEFGKMKWADFAEHIYYKQEKCGN